MEPTSMRTMTTIMELEHLIKCDICFDVFKFPQNLSCGHSFCKQCVARVTTNGIIAINNGVRSTKVINCPKCQKKCDATDTRVDYTIISLVDSCQNLQKELSTNPICEYCFIPSRKIAYRCETCCVILCTSCSNSHYQKNISVDARDDHHIKPIELVVSETKLGIKTAIKTLDVMTDKHQKTLQAIVEALRTIDTELYKIISKILMKEDSEPPAKWGYYQQLRKQAWIEREKQVEKMKHDYKKVKASLHSVIVQQHSLKGLTMLHSDVRIANSVDIISKILKEILRQQNNFEYPAPEKYHQFLVHINAKLCPLTSRKQQSKAIEILRGCKYYKLATGKYICMNSIRVTHQYDDYIYALHRDKRRSKIAILNKDFHLLATVDLLGQNYVVNGFDIMSLEYIVETTAYGLHMHTIKGGNIQRLAEGCFHGVKVLQNKIYAYEKGTNMLYVFTQLGSQWGKVEDIYMHYHGIAPKPDESKIESFFMNEDWVFLCDDKHIYQMDLKGCLMRKYSAILHMKKPIVCQIDSDKNILVVDTGRKRVVQFDQSGKMITINCTVTNIDHLYHALLNSNKETLLLSVKWHDQPIQLAQLEATP